jgi:hypothetical protein
VVHAQIAAWLKAVLPPAWKRSTVPSGGGGRIRGAQLKRMGLEPGLPDIILMHRDGWWLGLEVKRPGSGKTSEAQDDWIAWARGRIGVVRSIEDAQEFLRRHGVLK